MSMVWSCLVEYDGGKLHSHIPHRRYCNFPVMPTVYVTFVSSPASPCLHRRLRLSSCVPSVLRPTLCLSVVSPFPFPCWRMRSISCCMICCSDGPPLSPVSSSPSSSSSPSGPGFRAKSSCVSPPVAATSAQRALQHRVQEAYEWYRDVCDPAETLAHRSAEAL
jgi:hypothetical protein